MSFFVRNLTSKAILTAALRNTFDSQCRAIDTLPRKNGGYNISKYLTLLACPTIILAAMYASHEMFTFAPYEPIEKRKSLWFSWGERNEFLFHNPVLNNLAADYGTPDCEAVDEDEEEEEAHEQ